MSQQFPYKLAAADYFQAGWSPLPLPAGQKFPVPDGFTGASGRYVDEPQLKKWIGARARVNVGKLNYPPGNIALRLPRDVIGVDVDAYGEKAGEATLAAAEADWGPLPPTWVSTSRTDGASGIRLFRVPEGLAWPGELPQGKGVELLRWDHRYAIVAPSVHDKTGATYAWYLQELRGLAEPGGMPSGAGEELAMVEQPNSFPEPADLPMMPEAWVEGLTLGRNWKERAANEDMGPTEVRDWLAARNSPEEVCDTMRATVVKYSRELRIAGDDGGAHDAARDAAWAVIGDSAEGHGGIHKALGELRKVFISNVAGRRGRDNADGERLAKEEWARIVVRGVQKVSAEGEPEPEDPCVSLVSLATASGGGSDILTWRLDDIGNGERLIRTMDGRARWVPAFESWYLWDGARWRPDRDRQIERWAVKAVNKLEEELAYLEGDASEDVVKAFKAHKKKSGNVGSLRAMVEVAKGRKGIIVQAEEFDADPSLLNCPNGTVSLGRNGVERRVAHRPEDYLTNMSGAPYVADASADLWEKFIEHALPDPEVRDWVQRLVGYSLYGRNTERLFIVIYGPTSTGKTTFAEAIRGALGDYASSVNLSLFRDNQDERARPDLVRALRKRILFAEEASSSWHLHPDQVKRLTGGSEITARLPHSGHYLEAVPPFTPWLMTNATPSIEGADDAFWRRTRVVPFMETIPVGEEADNLGSQLAEPEARAAVLSWCVRGWARYREQTSLEQPAATWAVVEEFTRDASDMDRCLADVAVREPEAYELPRLLYNAYKMWCDAHGVRPESETKFGRFLKGRGFEKRSVRIDGKVQTPRHGLRLNDSWRKFVS